MLISFLDIFDATMSSILDGICVVEEGKMKLVLNGKKKLIQSKFIDTLCSLTNDVHEKIYIVIHNPTNAFRLNHESAFWYDEHALIDIYDYVEAYLKKNIKKLSMANSHVYSLIELDEVVHDDAIDVIFSAMKSMGISTTEPMKLQRQLFPVHGLKEVKLNKVRVAIENYIISKIPL